METALNGNLEWALQMVRNECMWGGGEYDAAALRRPGSWIGQGGSLVVLRIESLSSVRNWSAPATGKPAFRRFERVAGPRSTVRFVR